MRSLVFAFGLVMLACGEPPTAPASPGKMNTGGRPTPERTNGHGMGDTDRTNTKGSPNDPTRSVNASKGPAGGTVNLGGSPDFSKTTLPSFGGRDGGK